MIDCGGDGLIKPSDFEAFYKDFERVQQLVDMKEPDSIVELKVCVFLPMNKLSKHLQYIIQY